LIPEHAGVPMVENIYELFDSRLSTYPEPHLQRSSQRIARLLTT
jgi:hypothetical protein